MSLIKGLLAARSGLQANSRALNVTANNIANSQTTGYKAQRADFSDVFAASSLRGSGSGVQLSGVRRLQGQGSLERSGRSQDIALDGPGLFTVQDPNSGQRYYSRAGNLEVGADGSVLDQNGYQVLGFPADGGGAPGPLSLSDIQQAATGTSGVSVGGNLDSSSALVGAGDLPVAGASSFADYQSNATLSSTVQVYDSLGAEHSVTTYFYHTANTPNPSYEFRSVIDGADVGGLAGSPVEVGSGTIEFDSSGQRSDPVPAVDATLALPYSNGANPGSVDLSFSSFTQFAGSSSIDSVSQDGSGVGSVTGVFFESDGSVVAQLDTGGTQTVGTLAIARFENSEGLTPVGNSLFEESAASGSAILTQADTGGTGAVVGGALETSNVDLAEEFINAISFQRGFEANAKVIGTIDELLKEIIDIA